MTQIHCELAFVVYYNSPLAHLPNGFKGNAKIFLLIYLPTLLSLTSAIIAVVLLVWVGVCSVQCMYVISHVELCNVRMGSVSKVLYCGCDGGNGCWGAINVTNKPKIVGWSLKHFPSSSLPSSWSSWSSTTLT